MGLNTYLSVQTDTQIHHIFILKDPTSSWRGKVLLVDGRSSCVKQDSNRDAHAMVNPMAYRFSSFASKLQTVLGCFFSGIFLFMEQNKITFLKTQPMPIATFTNKKRSPQFLFLAPHSFQSMFSLKILFVQNKQAVCSEALYFPIMPASTYHWHIFMLFFTA